jgi:hypothetical protein
MADGQFRDLETYVVVERYKQDSSIVYELSDEDLDRLLNVMGEMEPIIDAINVRNGASVEQRAQDIGCDPEDFAYEIQGF